MASMTRRRPGRFTVVEEDGPYRCEWAERSALREGGSLQSRLGGPKQASLITVGGPLYKSVNAPVTWPDIVPNTVLNSECVVLLASEECAQV